MIKLRNILLTAMMFVIIVGIFVVSTQPFKVGASANNIDTTYMTKGGGSSTDTAVATTTLGVTYLGAGASTTFPFYSERAKSVSVDIAMTASTSAGVLVYTYETSNDSGSCHIDPNTCNWSLPANIASGVVASTSPVYTWRPDGQLNATTTLKFDITTNTTKFIRVKANISGSAGALWMSASRVNEQ